jgi:serine acetyltransferase
VQVSAKTLRKPLAVRISNRLLHVMARSLPGSTSLRPALHRMRGVTIGQGVFVGDDVYLENEYPERIEIQDNVEVGLRSVIIAHLRGPGRIIIKKHAWIGACCLIAASNGHVLTIGEGAVIGAGSVISADVPDHAVVRPLAAQHVANARVPLATSSYAEFFRGLRPVRRDHTHNRDAPAVTDKG